MFKKTRHIFPSEFVGLIAFSVNGYDLLHFPFISYLARTTGATSSRNCTNSTKGKGRAGRRSKPRSFGTPSLNLKSKPERLTCYTKTLAIARATSRISEPSNAGRRVEDAFVVGRLVCTILTHFSTNANDIFETLDSNLCTEIVEYSDEKEVAVCNLASIALNMFVKPDKTYDFEKLKYVSKVITRNLNKIIDINFYPIPEAERSNKRHRPIGIGVQGNGADDL